MTTKLEYAVLVLRNLAINKAPRARSLARFMETILYLHVGVYACYVSTEYATENSVSEALHVCVRSPPLAAPPC